ncbi:hypothetical protein Hanom_Chr09g00788791 [Helianthus anomalus]
MALILKSSHNYLPYLFKHDKNTDFHSVIDILTSSKYHTTLTINAPVYLDNLREVWANADFLLKNKKPFTFISKVTRKHTQITPQSISTTFNLNDMVGMESVPKNDLHNEFIERGI